MLFVSQLKYRKESAIACGRISPMKAYQFLLQSMERVLDFLLNFFSIYLSYYFVVFMYSPYFMLEKTEMWLTAAIVSVVAGFFYSYHNVYKPMRTQKAHYFLSRILLVHLEMVGFCTALVLWLHRGVYAYYMVWLSVSAILCTVVMMAKKLSLITILHNLRSNRRNIKYILMVTDSQEMVDNYMEEILRNPQFGYSVIGYIGNLSIVGLPHLGTTADLDSVLKEYRPDEVVMAFDTVRKKVITKYIAVCNDNCCKVLFIPSICGYFRAPRQVTTVGNMPMIDIRSTPLDNPTNQIIKRVMDIVLSLLLIIITSPLMILTAIGVRISSPGPIFFKQIRVGKNNKNFTMYKFRSMRVNDSEQTGWSNEQDPRKTKFGAFIRKFALDELPQFFNVLKGDMSLVGPRPEVPFYVEKFKKEIPLYMLKHTLRPGITGLAQIKGLRGDTSIADRIEEDINYIEHWSFWGDVRILLLTPFKAINRHEKYVERETEHQKRQEEKERRSYMAGKGVNVGEDTEGEKQRDAEEHDNRDSKS